MHSTEVDKCYFITSLINALIIIIPAIKKSTGGSIILSVSDILSTQGCQQNHMPAFTPSRTNIGLFPIFENKDDIHSMQSHS